MSATRTPRTFSILLTLLLVPLVSNAGNFDVSPIRVRLEKQAPTAVVTLQNRSRQSVVVHLELMKWSGQDKITPTRDLLVNPPIFTVPAESSQLVRIGLNTPIPGDRELAYRLYLQEIPPPPPKGVTGLRTALRVGIPIFIPPTQIRTQLDWRARRLADGKLRLEATNRGNVHVQLIELSLTHQGKPAARRNVRDYVFPGESRQWSFPPAENGAWNAETLNVGAHTDGGDWNEKVRVEGP